MNLPDVEATIDLLGTMPALHPDWQQGLTDAITLLRRMQKYRIRETAKEPPTEADANGLGQVLGSVSDLGPVKLMYGPNVIEAGCACWRPIEPSPEDV